MNGSPSMKAALFSRYSGSKSSCRWFYCLGIYTELERDYILDRQREGITVAKKNIHPVRVDEVFKEWKAGIITGVDAMHKLNMTRTKFYQRANEMGWMNTKDTKK